MKLKHFLYNAFLIEDATTKIAIDPGRDWLLGSGMILTLKNHFLRRSIRFIPKLNNPPCHRNQILALISANRILTANAPYIGWLPVKMHRSGFKTASLPPKGAGLRF